MTDTIASLAIPSGLRVVVTRPRSQAPGLVSALVDAGAEVIELAVIAIADPPDGGRALRAEAARVDTYDWVVFTSSNAIDRFVGLLRDGRALAGTRLAASADSPASNAWGCASSRGKCRNTKRILPGYLSRNSFGVAAAILQLGHSKSPYSTTVTRA